MSAERQNPHGFPETRWTLVVSSCGSDTRSERAMEELCRGYWYPLYAHARSRGCTPQDAEDLTQTFFAQMLQRETIRLVSQEAGRLRSYLLGALNNLIAQDWRHRMAQKRGGGAPVISIDHAAAEARLAQELTHSEDPVRLFNRRWAMALLDAVLAKLESEYFKQGNETLFGILAPFLGGHDGGAGVPDNYTEAAAVAGVTEGNFRVMVFRLRKRYRKLLRAEIAETVSPATLVDSEINELFLAVARS